MGTFKLALGIHNHQPIGNFQAVFDEAHRKAYLPFLEAVARSPHIRLSLHQSGILWQWQKRAHPEFFRLVGDLVDRGQVELLTGGFYEPILAAIPERDIRGQIELLTDYLEEHFETRPAGFWLAERVWEPHLPRPLARAGVRFLAIDDTHFLRAGLDPADLHGPYVTEHEGYALVLLPIRKRLRYLVPFGKPEEIVDCLKRAADRNPSGVAVYADDGEKFGAWPQTFEHCYANGWIQNFFEALEKNRDWLEVVPLGAAARLAPVGRVYLPSGSYAEMDRWALPVAAGLALEQFDKRLAAAGEFDRVEPFVAGGHWRGFLTKYEEANLLHKRMLAVSARLARLEKERPDLIPALAAARDRLYAGQCNCPYWHGVFGGLYLPHIRQVVHAALIAADRMAAEREGASGVRMERRDYDADGCDDVVVETGAFTAVFRPRRGATLVQLALRRHDFDVTDTLTRRREAYHLRVDEAPLGGAGHRTRSIHDRILAREPGLNALLTEDWYLKRCFIDHFFTADVDFDRFRSNRFGEEGDFIIEPFDIALDPADRSVAFARDGHLWRPDGVIPLRLAKRFVFSETQEDIAVDYTLRCGAGRSAEVVFGIENNWTFQAGHAEDRYVLIDGVRLPDSYLDGAAVHREVRTVLLADGCRRLQVGIVSDRPCEIWRLPIWTVSQSEQGFERVYQGTTVVAVYRLRLTEQPTVLSLRLAAGGLAEASAHRPRLD